MIGKEVIVGVDGSAGSSRAVDLAVREATLRGIPLRIVHAALGAHPDAGVVVTAAALQARLGDPNLTVVDQIIIGEPATVLLAEAADAALLVIGADAGGLAERLLGSVATRLLEQAVVPLLVARPGSHPAGHIVAGISGTRGDAETLAFAFNEAQLRGAPLLAVHTWAHPIADFAASLVPPLYSVTESEAEAVIELSEALAGWSEAYPDVAVHRRVLHARARSFLLGETERAQMVVLGAAGRRSLRKTTASLLMGQAQCPIAMVPHGEG